jgi:hypothetical protein
MTILTSYSLAIAVLLSFVYIVLALFSLGHIRTDKKARLSSILPVFFFWWPFYDELYTDSVGRLRLVGILIFLSMVVMYVLSFKLRS